MSTWQDESQQWEFVNAPHLVRRAGAAPDTTEGFPLCWRAYGPVGAESTRFSNAAYDATTGFRAEPLVSASVERLADVPERLAIGDRTFTARDMRLTDQALDFGELFGGHDGVQGKQAYAISAVEFDKPTQVVLGAGADYWMQIWIDGDEVLNTLPTGNMGAASVAGHCARHHFAAGRHLLVVRSISGQGSWRVCAGFVTAREELRGTRQIDRWEILPDDHGLMLPPKGLPRPGLALRTDLRVADETVACDFDLHSPEGQFGIVFGAQDPDNHYWAYLPRWGQNWRARAVYAVIARVEAARGMHARGLAMMLMPNVVAHWNAKLSMKVERRGDRIQMYVNGVKGPFIVDDTFGAGLAGIKGHTDFEVRNFKVSGRQVTAPAAPVQRERVAPRQVWFNPVKDTGYGTLRDPFVLLKLADGRILAGVHSREGMFFGPADPQARVNFYLSGDAGRTWRPHGDALPAGAVPAAMPWGIRWYEPIPGTIRAFRHGPAVRGEQKKGLPSAGYTPTEERVGWQLEDYEPHEILTYRDSTDLGLTWSDPKPSRLVGDWGELYREPCWNHIYGFTQLRDGTPMAMFLHGYVGMYACIGNKLTRRGSIGEGTWGTEVAQPYASRSEDGGRTWQAPVAMDNATIYDGIEAVDSPHGGWSETCFGELPGGRIVAVCRPYRSPYSWQTHSDDGGRTWRLVCYTSFSTSGGPQMIATASGYLAIVGRQTGLGLHTSVDGGTNWDAGTLLDHDCWFNGWLVEAEPDVALVFYFSPGSNGQPANPRMQRVAITEQGPRPA